MLNGTTGPDLLPFETSCSFNRRPFRPPVTALGAAKWRAQNGVTLAKRRAPGLHFTLNQHT